MADTILEDLKDYKGPTAPLPIAGLAVQLYEGAGFRLDDAGCDALRAELKKNAGDLKALTDNILSLGAFALFVRDSRKDMETAEKIAKIIGEHSGAYFPIGERIVAALQDLAFKAGDIFDQFSGVTGEEKRRAPKHDAAAPEGSLSAKKLIPVGEPPLHVKQQKKKKR